MARRRASEGPLKRSEEGNPDTPSERKQSEVPREEDENVSPPSPINGPDETSAQHHNGQEMSGSLAPSSTAQNQDPHSHSEAGLTFGNYPQVSDDTRELHPPPQQDFASIEWCYLDPQHQVQGTVIFQMFWVDFWLMTGL
jgi:hypothetical protein